LYYLCEIFEFLLYSQSCSLFYGFLIVVILAHHYGRHLSILRQSTSLVLEFLLEFLNLFCSVDTAVCRNLYLRIKLVDLITVVKLQGYRITASFFLFGIKSTGCISGIVDLCLLWAFFHGIPRLQLSVFFLLRFLFGFRVINLRRFVRLVKRE
jgi:hypothetical protein